MKKLREQLMSLYRTCFPEDSDKVVEYFFNTRLSPENALYRTEDGEVVCCLFLVHKSLRYFGQDLSLPYVVGLATRPDCRGRGLARSLMREAMERLYPHTPFLALYPFSHAFYEKMGFHTPSFDYTLVGEKTAARREDVQKIYEEFTKGLDFYIKREGSDFAFLRQIFLLDGGGFSLLSDGERTVGYTNGEEALPVSFYQGEKKGTMIRVVNARLAASYSKVTEDIPFRLTDGLLKENNGCFTLRNGSLQETDRGETDLSIAEFTASLFQGRGYLADRY